MAMQKEPRRRYASVQQFADDITRHLEGLPVVARGGGVLYQADKFVRPHKVGVTTALTLWGFATAFTISVIIQTTRIRHALEIADKERARAQQITGFLTGLFKA